MLRDTIISLVLVVLASLTLIASTALACGPYAPLDPAEQAAIFAASEGAQSLSVAAQKARAAADAVDARVQLIQSKAALDREALAEAQREFARLDVIASAKERVAQAAWDAVWELEGEATARAMERMFPPIELDVQAAK